MEQNANFSEPSKTEQITQWKADGKEKFILLPNYGCNPMQTDLGINPQ